MKKTLPAANPYQSLIEGKDPMKILASTHSRIVRLTEGLTQRQLSKRVSEDKWSIYEIVGHLADTETVHSGRCRWILFEDNPPRIPESSPCISV
ncbi:MAG: DinB family protein [Acidobacteriota bacterium]